MPPISTSRRKLVEVAGVLAMATASIGIGVRRADAQQVPYSSGTELPKLKAPANACDCHMHIYDAKSCSCIVRIFGSRSIPRLRKGLLNDLRTLALVLFCARVQHRTGDCCCVPL
jgi:hypothetical protein